MTIEFEKRRDPIPADPQWFIGELRRLRTACGAGSDRELARGVGGVSDLPHATISRALGLDRQTLPTADFVRRFATRCVAYADDHEVVLTDQDRDVARWLVLLAEAAEAIKAEARDAALETAIRWAGMFDLDGWKQWLGSALWPPGGLTFAAWDRLKAGLFWMVPLDWSKQFPQLGNAMANFLDVVSDLVEFFSENSAWSTRRSDFYEIHDASKLYFAVDMDKFHAAEREYVENVYLLRDLATELTAAANWVCDAVRAELDAGFRNRSPRLAVDEGPSENLEIHTTAYEYSPEQRARLRPYVGITTLREEVRGYIKPRPTRRRRPDSGQ